MKLTKIGVIASALIACGIMALTACQGKNSTTSASTSAASSKDTTTANAYSQQQPDSYLKAIDKYIVEEIGKNYDKSDVCIPQAMIVAADDKDDQDIKVWGDFWVFNYKIAGDTLKTASGGSHPGLIHLKKSGNGYEITSFERVADGADNLPSAKRIFGDKFDAFQKMNSNEKGREKHRAQGIATYVKEHNIKVTMYQDYGWPVVKLPE